MWCLKSASEFVSVNFPKAGMKWVTKFCLRCVWMLFVECLCIQFISLFKKFTIFFFMFKSLAKTEFSKYFASKCVLFKCHAARGFLVFHGKHILNIDWFVLEKVQNTHTHAYPLSMWTSTLVHKWVFLYVVASENIIVDKLNYTATEIITFREYNSNFWLKSGNSMYHFLLLINNFL